MRDYRDVMRSLNDANSRALQGDFSGANAVSDAEVGYLMNDPRMDIGGMMNEIGLELQRTEGQS